MQETLQKNRESMEGEPVRRRYLCPLCSKHTVLWLLPTTLVVDLPIKCKRCGNESVVSIMPTNESHAKENVQSKEVDV